jgi:hypothetical protein
MTLTDTRKALQDILEEATASLGENSIVQSNLFLS